MHVLIYRLVLLLYLIVRSAAILNVILFHIIMNVLELNDIMYLKYQTYAIFNKLSINGCSGASCESLLTYQCNHAHCSFLVNNSLIIHGLYITVHYF